MKRYVKRIVEVVELDGYTLELTKEEFVLVWALLGSISSTDGNGMALLNKLNPNLLGTLDKRYARLSVVPDVVKLESDATNAIARIAKQLK